MPRSSYVVLSGASSLLAVAAIAYWALRQPMPCVPASAHALGQQRPGTNIGGAGRSAAAAIVRDEACSTTVIRRGASWTAVRTRAWTCVGVDCQVGEHARKPEIRQANLVAVVDDIGDESEEAYTKHDRGASIAQTQERASRFPHVSRLLPVRSSPSRRKL